MSDSDSHKPTKPRQAVTLLALEARIAALQAKAAKLKEQDRAQDTRAKIVLGGAVLADPDARRLLAEWVTKAMGAARPADRVSWERVAQAFGEQQPSSPDTEATPASETEQSRRPLVALLGGSRENR